MPLKTWYSILLQWLLNEFLVYLENWEQSVATRPDPSPEVKYTDGQRNRMMISPETRLGLKMTGMLMDTAAACTL